MKSKRHPLWATAAAAAAATLASGCAAATAANHASTTSGSSRNVATCTTAQLRMSRGPFVEPLSQQHVLTVTLTNTSARTCTLRGYPGITLRTRSGEALAVTYRDAGDEMLTSRRPATVTLAPGTHAYIAINQFTCNSWPPSSALADRIDVRLPAASGKLTIGLQHNPYLTSCGRRDPGRFIDIAPIEPSVRALLHF